MERLTGINRVAVISKKWMTEHQKARAAQHAALISAIGHVLTSPNPMSARSMIRTLHLVQAATIIMNDAERDMGGIQLPANIRPLLLRSIPPKTLDQ